MVGLKAHQTTDVLCTLVLGAWFVRIQGERFDAIIFNFPYGGTFLQNVNKMKHGNGLHRATRLPSSVSSSCLSR